MSTTSAQLEEQARQWRAARALFEAVAELPAADCEAALQRADPATAALVRRLLKADSDGHMEAAEAALQATASLLLDGPTEADLAGQRIGPWCIEAQIGSGGMGTVFRAARDDGEFDGKAAVKFMAGAGTAARFQAEKQALGRLQHAHIARILDAGTHPDWGPYLVMEHVDGLPLDRYCAQQRLPASARIRLLLQVVDAIAHAHAQLVLHRDLKPNNVLVTAGGRAVVLDLGLAKFLCEQRLPDGTANNAFTPRYAAPEQLAHEPLGVPADVYALAVMLYELLSGQHPFLRPGETETRVLMQRVLAGDAVPLRRALAQGAACRLDLGRSALRDLEAVLAHALQRDPARSFQSADAFGDELRRVLADRPVQLRRTSALARLLRGLRRHWPLAAGTAVAVLGLAVATGVSWRYAREAEDQRDAALASAERARQLATVLTDAFSASNPRVSHGEPLTAKDVLDRSTQRIASDAALAADPLQAAELEAVLGETYRSIGALAESEAVFERALARLPVGEAPLLRGRLLAGLGWVRAYQARWADAEALLREGITAFEQAGDAGREPAAQAWCRMATPLMNQERPDAALEALHAGIAVADAAGGLERTAASCRSTLASIHVLRGEHDAAERYYAEAIARAGEDPQLQAIAGGAHSNLGALRLRQGRFEEAAQAYGMARAMLSRELGSDNPGTALAMLGLAQALRGAGLRPEAREAFAAARQAYGDWHGEDHRSTAYTRLLEAEFHYLDGDAAQASLVLADAPAVLVRRGTADEGCRARAVQRGIAALAGRPEASDADWPKVRACLEAQREGRPLVHALAVLVEAEHAVAHRDASAAARVRAAEAELKALVIAHPLLAARVQALRERLGVRE